MAAQTPAMAKNIIRRSFSEIIDPSPSKSGEKEIWAFFNSECIFCGKKLTKTRRDGHIDHLVPSSLGGRNNISNRVLSCATCNGDERRDMNWPEFLLQKKPNEYKLRSNKIHQWEKLHPAPSIPKVLEQQIEIISNRVIHTYDHSISEARRLI
jgi:5-methylcytosine-specific restriction endonuclease McrA